MPREKGSNWIMILEFLCPKSDSLASEEGTRKWHIMVEGHICGRCTLLNKKSKRRARDIERICSCV